MRVSYEQSEMIIQQLLAEAGATEVSNMPVSVEGRGVEAAADWRTLKSAENYVGYRADAKLYVAGRSGSR